MKYIITDKGEVKTGGMYHQDMGDHCEGRVISAGHYDIINGLVKVHGSSIGYGINAKPEDAIILQKHLNINVPVQHQVARKAMPEAHWENGLFDGKCDRENCLNRVTHRAFDDYTAEAVCLKSLCDEHWKKGTQKKWIKKIRKERHE